MTGRVVPARTKWAMAEMHEHRDAEQRVATGEDPAKVKTELFRSALVDVAAMLDAGMSVRAHRRLAAFVETLDR
jgi:hypothetical protein